MNNAHLSLFSGIGGLDLAAEWAGFKTVAFVERDPYCQRVLAKHWPGVPIYSDVAEVGAAVVAYPEGEQGGWGEQRGVGLYPCSIGRIGLLSGGFPCQPHSVAGKRQASADDRDLWPEFARVIREIRPRWVVAENVPGLLNSESGRFFGSVLGDLAEMGYSAGWGVWGACHVGALHRRERVFIVAHAECRGRAGSRECSERSHPAQEGEGEANHAFAECFGDFWRVEPGMGGTFDGFPSWLHRHCGRGMSYAESERSVKALRGLWNSDVAKALWGTARGHDRVQQAEILFSFLRELKAGGWAAGEFVAGEKAQEVAMRIMRGAEKPSCSPHRSEPVEQRSGQPSDALQMVSQLSSCDGETPWHRSAWEDGIPRVANGVKDRVNRLRALGNAVVPQQAYPLFKAIAEIEGIA